MLPSPLVVFTDLDGTLLDAHTYSWAAATNALEELQRRRIPLVFVTSKTRAEVEPLQRKLGTLQPFITENGGGIFVPHGYFPQRLEGARRAGRFHCLALGRPYADVVEALAATAEAAGVEVVGFRQMSAREIAQNTGLGLAQAARAREREFDEPFFFAGADPPRIEEFLRRAALAGLTITRGGRFWHACAGSDKGRAVQKLMKLYREARPGGRRRQRSAGLGDSANDLGLLASVDLPVLLPQPGGGFDPEVLQRLPRVRRGTAPGPAGWNEAVLAILGA